MRYYLAPMEGITTYIYRMAFHRYFGCIDRYLTPFIASSKMNRRELNEILPEHNAGICLVPQILADRADVFLQIAQRIASFGYDTVNLNLGCPSGTVTARGRGAGFLGLPDKLDAFLYEIFERSPLKISVKTRIGIASEEEWPGILQIYQKYPIEELIVHPRLQQDQYRGTPHMNAFRQALETLTVPLCYNGDIDSPAAHKALTDRFPSIDRIMIGRGLIKDPSLACRLRDPAGSRVKKTVLRAFHDELFDAYAAAFSGETPVLYKMKDLWTYMSQRFTGPDRYLKKIRKAGDFSAYRIAVDSLFREQELTADD